MNRTLNLLILAVVAVTLAACLTGCGAGSSTTTDPLPFVSDIPSENWATPDSYRVHVQAIHFVGDVSHPLNRAADGCIHVKKEWVVDTWIVRDEDSGVTLSGGIDGIVRIWNIASRYFVPDPDTKAGEWRSLPTGTFRFEGMLAGSDRIVPFETVKVE